MSRTISKAKLLFATAALGALTLGTAAPAQAGDFSVSFDFSSHSVRPCMIMDTTTTASIVATGPPPASKTRASTRARITSVSW